MLSVSAVNDDGGDILSEIDMGKLINRNIGDAIDSTIEQIEADGYITDDDDNYMVISANTRAEDHTDRLLEEFDKRFKDHKDFESISFKISDDELNEAHKQGISGGKKKMIDSLEEASKEPVDRDKWKNKSVREIVKERDRVKNKPDEEENKNKGGDPDSSRETKEETYSQDVPEDKPDQSLTEPVQEEIKREDSNDKPDDRKDERPASKPDQRENPGTQQNNDAGHESIQGEFPQQDSPQEGMNEPPQKEENSQAFSNPPEGNEAPPQQPPDDGMRNDGMNNPEPPGDRPEHR